MNIWNLSKAVPYPNWSSFFRVELFSKALDKLCFFPWSLRSFPLVFICLRIPRKLWIWHRCSTIRMNYTLTVKGGSRLNMEKAMASHSSTLAWRIPWMGEHGRLQSTGSQKSWTGFKWPSVDACGIEIFLPMLWNLTFSWKQHLLFCIASPVISLETNEDGWVIWGFSIMSDFTSREIFCGFF